MKTLSAQVTGFTAGSPTMYTTQVHLDGETWTVPVRYSTFREFYTKIDALEPDFAFDFPQKGGWFSSPPPSERQGQLDAFLKKAIAHFAEREFPQDVLDLLDDLLDISAHVVKRANEADTESSASEQEDDAAVNAIETAEKTAASVEAPAAPAVAASVSVEVAKSVEVAPAPPAAEVVVAQEPAIAVVEPEAPAEVVVTEAPAMAAVETPVAIIDAAPAAVLEAAPAAADVTVAPVAVEVAPAAETVDIEPVVAPAAVATEETPAPAVKTEAVEVAAAFEKIVESVKLTLEAPVAIDVLPAAPASRTSEPPSPTASETEAAKKKRAKKLSEAQKRMRNLKRKEKRKKKSGMKVRAITVTSGDSDDEDVRVALPAKH